MTKLDRRNFLSTLTASAGAALLPAGLSLGHSGFAPRSISKPGTCWLEVTAPFVLDDDELGVRSEIVLTSNNFSGRDGHIAADYKTDYEILLFEPNGQAVGTGGVAKRLTVPAMRTTVIPIRDIIGGKKSFFGGMTVRLRPQSPVPTHAGDLFGSAYIRWRGRHSFDNVHANPDPIQWQRPDSFFYSMPFPSLDEYECVYCLFNPYAQSSAGSVCIYDDVGNRLRRMEYNLQPHSSVLVDVRRGRMLRDFRKSLSAAGPGSGKVLLAPRGGTVAVMNDSGSVKNFGYLMIGSMDGKRFGVEHPIHQSPFVGEKKPAPFDEEGRFRLKNILYSPLVFKHRRIGGITLDSKFHFSSGAPPDEHLWLKPFVTGPDGAVAWQHSNGTPLPESIARKQVERGAVKLGGKQSCIFDLAETHLPDAFSGGISLATAPFCNHTLMKVEVRVPEWGTHAFTHFRPGLAAAKAYQKFPERGGLVTDYVCSAARVTGQRGARKRDEVIGVMNIDDRGDTASPTLEVFNAEGLVERINLEKIPGFACRHFLLSDLSDRLADRGELTLRLTDTKTILIMSVLHIDYELSDIALDHGSDRFSTYQDFNCNMSA